MSEAQTDAAATVDKQLGSEMERGISVQSHAVNPENAVKRIDDYIARCAFGGETWRANLQLCRDTHLLKSRYFAKIAAADKKERLRLLCKLATKMYGLVAETRIGFVRASYLEDVIAFDGEAWLNAVNVEALLNGIDIDDDEQTSINVALEAARSNWLSEALTRAAYLGEASVAACSANGVLEQTHTPPKNKTGEGCSSRGPTTDIGSATHLFRAGNSQFSLNGIPINDDEDAAIRLTLEGARSRWYGEALQRAQQVDSKIDDDRSLMQCLEGTVPTNSAVKEIPTVTWSPGAERTSNARVAATEADMPKGMPEEPDLHATVGSPTSTISELATLRERLLARYKQANDGVSNQRIYTAKNSHIHKPEFYGWKRGNLSRTSATAKNFERFLRDKKPCIRKAPRA